MVNLIEIVAWPVLNRQTIIAYKTALLASPSVVRFLSKSCLTRK